LRRRKGVTETRIFSQHKRTSAFRDQQLKDVGSHGNAAEAAPTAVRVLTRNI
jgi:hypothetical protein